MTDSETKRAYLDTSVRYYPDEMPQVGDLVVVKVTKISDTAAYVHLVEYANIEGMVPYTELSRRRIRSIANHIRVGKQEIVTVIRLDKQKGYIDLSKKQVTDSDRQRCDIRYQKGRKVHSIMRQAAVELHTKTPEKAIECFRHLMQNVAFPLYEKYGHSYDALKRAIDEPDKVLAPLNLKPDELDAILRIAKHKLKEQEFKLQADLEVTCFTAEGVDAIRDCLLVARNEGANEPKMPVHVQINGPPSYTLRTQTELREEGVAKLWKCVKMMETMMRERGGDVKVKRPPAPVGDDGEYTSSGKADVEMHSDESSDEEDED